MFAERLAVVTDHHHDGVVVQIQPGQPGQQPSHFRVDVGDLGVVRAAGVALLVLARWLIGRMGIEVVNPEHEIPVGPTGRPRQGTVGHLGGVPFRVEQGVDLVRLLETVVVVRESLSQTVALAEHE